MSGAEKIIKSYRGLGGRPGTFGRCASVRVPTWARQIPSGSYVCGCVGGLCSSTHDGFPCCWSGVSTYRNETTPVALKRRQTQFERNLEIRTNTSVPKDSLLYTCTSTTVLSLDLTRPDTDVNVPRSHISVSCYRYAATTCSSIVAS